MSLFTTVIPYRFKKDNFTHLSRVVDSVTTPYIISSYGALDERIKGMQYIHTEADSWSRSAALNVGIALCDSDFVFCNDADCLWIDDVELQISEAFAADCHVLYKLLVNGRVDDYNAKMQGFNKNWDMAWDARYETYGRADIDLMKQASMDGRATKYLSGGIECLR